MGTPLRYTSLKNAVAERNLVQLSPSWFKCIESGLRTSKQIHEIPGLSIPIRFYGLDHGEGIIPQRG